MIDALKTLARTSIAVAVGCAPALHAATHTWTGAATASWSNPANWTGGAPAPGEPGLVLNFPHVAAFSSTNDIVGLTIQTLHFSDGAFMDGNAVTMTGAITFDASVASSFVQVAFDVTLSGTPTITVTNGLGLGLDGVLSGASGLVKAGGGELQLHGANTYSGPTLANAGNLSLWSGSALGAIGSGTSVASGAGVFANNGITVAEPLSLAAGSRLQATNGANVWAGPIVLGGTASVASNLSPTALTVSGLISGAAGIDVTAGGPLTLLANNTYTGTTNLTFGATATIEGSQPQSAVAIDGSATLRGGGTVGAVTINSISGGGAVRPGSANTGILTTGPLSAGFGPNATLGFRLNGLAPGTGYDRLSVTGNADITGFPLQLTRGFLPPVSTTFTILQCSGTLSGTFAGLPNNATFSVGGQSYRINYTASAVVLTVLDTQPVELESFEVS